MGKRAAGRNSGLEAAQSIGFVVASCLCLFLSLAFATGAVRRTAGTPAPLRGGRINPNDASVSSLARLPGIGLTRARAIVALREDLQDHQGRTRVFHRPEDLMQVRGIGPATVEGLRPWLEFGPLSNNGNAPAPGAHR